VIPCLGLLQKTELNAECALRDSLHQWYDPNTANVFVFAGEKSSMSGFASDALSRPFYAMFVALLSRVLSATWLDFGKRNKL
jgi:hypothetical protein